MSMKYAQKKQTTVYLKMLIIVIIGFFCYFTFNSGYLVVFKAEMSSF